MAPDLRLGADAAPALLVPMTLEAVTLVRRSDTPSWSWATPSYQRLRYFEPVATEPFTQSPPVVGGGPFTGALLHWSLPDGVAHGAQAGAGRAVTYPAAPNRWLVMRTAPDPADATRWRSTAWVVASDVVGDPAGSPFPTASGEGGTSLGRSWPLADWPGEAALRGSTLVDPLTAVGPGDATYAAYVPGVANVFAFADTLADVERGPVAYEVVGWYADPLADPMRGVSDSTPDGWQTVEQWADVLARRGWSVGDAADLDRAVQAASAWAVAHGLTVDPTRPRTTHPARTLCHGMLSGLSWAGPDGPPLSGVPTTDPQRAGYVRPTVAVGHNAVDALAATIAEGERGRLEPEEVAQLVRVLQAFEHDELALLDARDSQAQLDLVVQQAWFSSTPGGTRWTLADAPDDTRPQGRSAPPLDAATRRALSDLTRLQSELDARTRDLASAQARYASAWWKVARLDHWPPPPPDDAPPEDEQRAARDDLAAAGPAALAQVGGVRVARQARDRAFVALRRALDARAAGDPEGTPRLELRAAAAPPFSAPADPVLLVTGAHRSFTHGEDGRFTEDGTLACRFTGQTVDGIEVDVAPDGSGGGDDVVLVDAASVRLPLFEHPDLPPELPDLVAERFFLDTSSAPEIAVVARPPDPWPLLGRIRDAQTLVWNAAAHPGLDVEALADASGLHFVEGLGAVPSKVGVEVWRPPWTPLYLDWSVRYVAGAPTALGALDAWEPPRDRDPAGEDDLTWTWRTGHDPADGARTGLSGRTLLTPQVSDLVAERLEATIDSLGQAPDVQEDLWALLLLLDRLRHADVLSQALSGFGALVLQQQTAAYRLPADGTLDPVLRPDGAPAFEPVTVPRVDAPADSFVPVRGGHLSVQRLWVVDAFGQVFDVLAALAAAPGELEAVRAPDLVTATSPVLAELKPRLGQPSRLTLEWLDAATDEPVDAASGSPVCGWFVVDHLDRSLLVHGADGMPLGSLVATPGGARWVPAPETSPPPHGGTPDVVVPDRHLRAAVLGVLRSTDSRAALLDLLEVVDRATWSVDPTGGWADEELPVLIGRPLAVVRAGLRLELYGAPATRQTWADSGHATTDGFPALPVPVQLGSSELLDDGLVGCFVDDDYAHLVSVYARPPAGAGAVPSADAYVTGFVDGHRPVVRPDGATGTLVTLVLDPRSTVHAVSGIGPVVTAAVPPGLVDDAIARLSVTFRVGPVLGGPTVAMPLPALREGTWSWLEYDDPKSPAQRLGVEDLDASASLPDTLPLVREGWLSLELGGPPTRLTYGVDPGLVPVTVDPRVPATVALRLTAYNPTADPVAVVGLRFTLPVGGDAADLVSSAATAAARVLAPDDTTWLVAVSGPHVVVLPSRTGAVVPAGHTLVVLVAGLPVTTAPGRAVITVDEVTDTTRSTSVSVTKTATAPAPPAPTT